MIKIKFNENKKQAIALENDNQIGECNYEVKGDTWNIIHTSVSESHQGQGIAKQLVECVMSKAKKQRKNIVADCGYAKKIITKQKKNEKMNMLKVGVAVVILGWLIPTIGFISTWGNFFVEKALLNSEYNLTQAEICLNEEDYDEMNGYRNVTLKYTVNDEVLENKFDRNEYKIPVVNGGLIKIMYNENDTKMIKVVKNKTFVYDTISFVIFTFILVYIMKRIYPRVVRSINETYKDDKYIDAPIISCDYLNRLIAMDASGDKIRIYKSVPYFNDKNNMQLFLKSKNIDKIRIYIDKNNEKNIVMDYEAVERGEE